MAKSIVSEHNGLPSASTVWRRGRPRPFSRNTSVSQPTTSSGHRPASLWFWPVWGQWTESSSSSTHLTSPPWAPTQSTSCALTWSGIPLDGKKKWFFVYSEEDSGFPILPPLPCIFSTIFVTKLLGPQETIPISVIGRFRSLFFLGYIKNRAQWILLP